MTGELNASTNIQSFRVNGTVLNTVSNNGTYRIIQCNETDPIIAISNHGLANRPT